MQLQGHQKGKLSSQPEQAMCITIHHKSQEIQISEGIEIESVVEEILEDKMPLHPETKDKDIEELKEEIDEAPKPTVTDKLRELLSLPSLNKVENPYKPLIPLKCCPKEDQN